MLQKLQIKNYALLEEVTILFDASLTVITGETGAGKSIMLGALGLVLGERADMAVLRDKQKKCVVEADFLLKNYDLQAFFTEHELDYNDQTILRREITPDGKSRAFVNDTPVTLNILKQLAHYLIDVHSQHETLLLNQAAFRYNIVDAFAGCLAEQKQYRFFYTQLKEKEKELQELLTFEQQAKKETDYFQFQFNELEQAVLKEGILHQLEQEYDALNNAELIKQSLTQAYSSLDEEGGILSQFSSLKNNLNSLTRYGKTYEELAARLQSAQIELKDITAEIENANERIVFDAKKLETITAQLDTLNRLLKKHGVKEETALLAIKTEIEKKLSQFSSVEEEVQKRQQELKTLSDQIWKKAHLLFEKRKKAIPLIQKSIQDMLADLSMPNARIEIRCMTAENLNLYGCNELQFLFSANKGLPLSELHKVASGGELSRLMLCLKAHIAEKTALPTIIFDEIDTGVSGDVAHKIGTILLRMGKAMQVVAITHLPQLASKGKQHIFVYKQELNDQTQSSVKILSAAERIVEIAKMLSTGTPTESALLNAKELLNTKN
ncbi:MAG: DNA repair protein RecN [Bacteroidetes bacterium]|nr:DNA repair protein RecN [Bacteroidota bacterium]